MKLYLKSPMIVTIQTEQILNVRILLISYFPTRTWVEIFRYWLLDKLCEKFCLSGFLITTEKHLMIVVQHLMILLKEKKHPHSHYPGSHL